MRVAGRGDSAASWRPFQLAFILMQLGALTDPTTPRRSADHQARVELLFFPTGGGKTEAYLGLAAYTFAIRRRQGVLHSAEGPLDGNDGVAVLMRYTLRLLTAQQFQRATALMCAAELARRADETTWGTEPFRIGLWVGTDVSPKRFEEADEQLTRANEYGAHRLTVLQIQRCPWCGTPITAAHVKADATLRRVFVHCGDELARCPFAKGGAVTEGLPILTVDEEIYRLTPAFVIATVDKFARLAREGEAAALFGYVGQQCGRHGYVHPDYAACNISTAHPATKGQPAATVRPVDRLRPPDLIIQDELHLITGALGTSVGLFEVAVETLSSWETPDGAPVRPLIVASTATVRNAQEQVRGLYGRQVEIFPPQVLDVADTYFSEEIPISQKWPGRRYLGVSAQGVRLSSAEIRVAEVLLSAGQLLFDRCKADADPYMTLVGYFNATRELAGMTRYMADDVQNRVKRPRKDSGFPSRLGASFGLLNIGELTSRIASAEIGQTLDRLGLEFDPDYDTTDAMRTRLADKAADKRVAARKESPFDVVLATSMLQVGVDVQRLGLMLVVGQPKNTAEYIQASSRVGRDATDRPGLVVALGNWARPRDLAHFEQFRHYHETFYAQVEALSVTPYSPTSLARGIDGLLVSVARVTQAFQAEGLSPERSAWRIKDNLPAVERIVERLKKRIAAASLDEEATKRASDLLVNRIDRWSERAKRATEMSKTLVYERTGEGDKYLPLIISPEEREGIRRKFGPGAVRDRQFDARSATRDQRAGQSHSRTPLLDGTARRTYMATARRTGRLMTDTVSADSMLHDSTEPLDPLADVDEGIAKNRAKVGSARPSSLLYTYGPGAIMDLPGFAVMPAGLDDWEPIWKRREHIPTIVEPRLLKVVQLHLGPQVTSLRPYPWQPKLSSMSKEGTDLGIPARVFPQWFRCTGCDYLGPLPRFSYTNTHPYRPDLAQFTHKSCPGRGKASGTARKRESPAVPAQHLLTCTNGHLDEFPYALWVHRGAKCQKAELPDLKMRDANLGKSVGSTIICQSCGKTRGMAEAQGRIGREKLPQKCRGRHPHLNAFDPECDARPALIMMGASNLWFGSTQSIIVMPRTDSEKSDFLADRLKAELGVDQIKQFAAQLDVIRALAGAKNVDVAGISDLDLATAITTVLEPPDSDAERRDKLEKWDPIELLVPEWRYLQQPALFPQQANTTGLMVTEMQRGPDLANGISRVVAVNQMKKVNAFLGFTRLDELDRVNDVAGRLVKLTRNGKPAWVPATEDRGEGIFLQLNLSEVDAWESLVSQTSLWQAHREANRRNFQRRFSETVEANRPG